MKVRGNILLILLTLSSFISYNEAFEADRLIERVKRSIRDAQSGYSKLTDKILGLDGLSSSKVRHFLNNVCSLPGSRYLEIGVYRGSTFISALYQNSNSVIEAIAIDNWSEFGIQRKIFLDACNKYLKPGSFNFHEGDSFKINIAKVFINPINIYFYDGSHSFEAQYKAFTYYNEAFTDTFIAVVDDWNWDQVKNGTKRAFKDLGYTILYEEVLPANYNGDVENWWNGLYVAVIQK